MPYRYELFISYSWRVPRAQSWVRDVLVPPLYEFLDLQAKIPKESVFLDDRVNRPGMDVEKSVHEALRDSKVLLAILSPQYFDSGWCLTEFHTLLDRQQATKQHIIYPIAVWDGHKYPADIKNLNPLDFNKWGTLERGMRRKRWNDTVLDLVKELEKLIANSPQHDPTWTINLKQDPVQPHVERQGY
jgi:TIR domain.